jgi:hypothetical protein
MFGILGQLRILVRGHFKYKPDFFYKNLWLTFCPELILIFLHILPAPPYIVAVAPAASCIFNKSLRMHVQPSLHKKLNFLVGCKYFPSQGLLVDRTGENRLAPCQDCRWGVAVPPNAFLLMFLLSQWRRADTRCHGGNIRFWLIDLVVLSERLALLGR